MHKSIQEGGKDYALVNSASISLWLFIFISFQKIDPLVHFQLVATVVNSASQTAITAQTT